MPCAPALGWAQHVLQCSALTMAQCCSGSSQERIAPAAQELVGVQAVEAITAPDHKRGTITYRLLGIITLIHLLWSTRGQISLRTDFFLGKGLHASFTALTRVELMWLLLLLSLAKLDRWRWRQLMDSAAQLWLVLEDLRKYCLWHGMSGVQRSRCWTSRWSDSQVSRDISRVFAGGQCCRWPTPW